MNSRFNPNDFQVAMNENANSAEKMQNLLMENLEYKKVVCAPVVSRFWFVNFRMIAFEISNNCKNERNQYSSIVRFQVTENRWREAARGKAFSNPQARYKLIYYHPIDWLVFRYWNARGSTPSTIGFHAVSAWKITNFAERSFARKSEIRKEVCSCWEGMLNSITFTGLILYPSGRMRKAKFWWN